MSSIDTIKAAIDEAVPAAVLTTALYARFGRLCGQTAVGDAFSVRGTSGETGRQADCEIKETVAITDYQSDALVFEPR
jgi:hypothetical protein